MAYILPPCLASLWMWEGSQKIEKTNLSRPLQYTSLFISASPRLPLFHPVDPISWQSDLHLMEQQLCAVAFVSVFALFLCVRPVSLTSCQLYFLIPNPTDFYPPSKTPSPSLFVDLFCTSLFQCVSPPLGFSHYIPLHLSHPVMHLSLLCRAGRPIITPACKYWSTAPVCMCYFKMLRPVIRALMIVIAKAASSVWLFQACGYQRKGWQPEHTHSNKHTYTHMLRGWMEACWSSNEGGALLWGSLGQICSEDRFRLSVRHNNLSFYLTCIISPGPLQVVCLSMGIKNRCTWWLPYLRKVMWSV